MKWSYARAEQFHSGRTALCANAVRLVRLRRPNAAAWARWGHDPAVVRWFKGKPRWSADDCVFAIECRTCGRCVGEVSLTDHHADRVELRAVIGEPDHRGLGMGRQAVALAVAYAVHELCVKEVYLRVRPQNRRALRCYEWCGFVRDGFLPARRSPFRPAVLLMSWHVCGSTGAGAQAREAAWTARPSGLAPRAAPKG